MSIAMQRLATVITCHDWNADKTRVAVCPNSNEVHIYKVTGNDLELEHVLPEHDQTVMGIHWGHKKNRLVTCSQDRNAFVWNYNDQEKVWEPTLVILRLNRAATKCKWSPKEDKFAVASGAKIVAVCYFDEDNNWWVSKHIKNHFSTVLDLDWHPNNALLATACADNVVRVCSAFVRNVDNKADFKQGTPFGKKLPFGKVLKELPPAGGWTRAVKWSPSGHKLGIMCHDSTVLVLDCEGTEHTLHVGKYQGLPYRDFIWATENSLIAAGFQYSPDLWNFDGSEWKFVARMDVKEAGGQKKMSAMAKFRAMDSKGQGSKMPIPGLSITTKHKNCVGDIVVKDMEGGNLKTFSTTGLDGHFIIWDVAKIKSTESKVVFA